MPKVKIKNQGQGFEDSPAKFAPLDFFEEFNGASKGSRGETAGFKDSRIQGFKGQNCRGQEFKGRGNRKEEIGKRGQQSEGRGQRSEDQKVRR